MKARRGRNRCTSATSAQSAAQQLCQCGQEEYGQRWRALKDALEKPTEHAALANRFAGAKHPAYLDDRNFGIQDQSLTVYRYLLTLLPFHQDETVLLT
jgi:hypothetical protein